MKERPILFSGEMVRAILDGRKTQTRRVVKPQPIISRPPPDRVTGHEFSVGGLDYLCPYGQPGDRLWVRETFRSRRVDGLPGDVMYRADHPGGKTVPGSYGRSWKPSIHMPRWASRITLEITAVRVERLQDMNAEDALAEGCPGGHGSIPGYGYSASPGEHFRHVWQSINGAGSWDANPWVWVVEFRQLEKTP